MDVTVSRDTVKHLYEIPDGLLEATPYELEALLSEPTLIHLSGVHNETLFISVLLHGNEPTGFLAVQALLRKYQTRTLPRALSVLFWQCFSCQNRGKTTCWPS